MPSPLRPNPSSGTLPAGRRTSSGPGAGKTCLARYCLHQLREEDPHVRRRHINCWEHFTTTPVVYQLTDGVGKAADIRPDTVSHDELLRRVRDANKSAYVVVFDEVDQIEEPHISS